MREIKVCFKTKNKKYEKVVAPLTVLFDQKPINKFLNNGTRIISYYEAIVKLFYKSDSEIIKKINNLEYETLSQEKFNVIETMLEDDELHPNKVKGLSGCFLKLLVFLSGLIELHRSVRPYSLSSYDFEILSKDEQEILYRLDRSHLQYLKLLRYTTTYCKGYEKNAKEILFQINK